MKRFRSEKAEAWAIVARIASERAVWHEWYGVPEQVAEHILRVVVPSLRRRAERIERNSKRGMRLVEIDPPHTIVPQVRGYGRRR